MGLPIVVELLNQTIKLQAKKSKSLFLGFKNNEKLREKLNYLKSQNIYDGVVNVASFFYPF